MAHLCCLLAVGFSSCHMDSPFSIGLLEYSHDVAVAFPTADPREQGWSCTVTEDKPIQCWGEGQGHECQEVETPGGRLKGQISHIVYFLSMHKNSVQVLLSSFYRWSFLSLPKITKLSKWWTWNLKQVCLLPEPMPLPLYSATSQETSPLGT